jgi:hypothetical protein
MKEAAACASHVIRSLPEQSLVNVMGFGSDCYPVFTPFLAPLTDWNKGTMANTFQRLQPNGMTALYDTIIMWSLTMLSFVAAAHRGGVDISSCR